MGCTSSKDTDAQPPRRPIQIGAPQDVTIHIPRNRLQPNGAPMRILTVEIPRDVLVRALSMTASYIKDRGRDLTAIAVGGAVNTIFLRTRLSTHDVDVFGTNLGPQDRILLDEAVHYTLLHIGEPISTEWFNTETSLHMSPRMHNELTDLAFEKNIVIFKQPGLTVLAAPWNYAFGAKVDRLLKVMAEDLRRPYDLQDAIVYLDQMVTANSGRPIAIERFFETAQRYHQNTTEAYLMNTVNHRYQQSFHRQGIASSRSR